MRYESEFVFSIRFSLEISRATSNMIRALLEANDESGMWLSICKDSTSCIVLH
jgi:hypothetical protein